MLGSIALVLLGFTLGAAVVGLAACFVIGVIYRQAVETVEANSGYLSLRTYKPHTFGAPPHDPLGKACIAVP